MWGVKGSSATRRYKTIGLTLQRVHAANAIVVILSRILWNEGPAFIRVRTHAAVAHLIATDRPTLIGSRGVSGASAIPGRRGRFGNQMVGRVVCPGGRLGTLEDKQISGPRVDQGMTEGVVFRDAAWGSGSLLHAESMNPSNSQLR